MQDDTNKKDNVRALIVTIAFHGVLVACFLLFGLSTPLPLPEEHGVVVSLGYDDDGTGFAQPLRATPPVPQSPQSAPESPREEIVTQETEESVVLPDVSSEQQSQREEPESERQDPLPIPEETARVEQVVDTVPVVDPRALFPGRDQRSTDRQDQGETGRQGDQGRREGVTDAGVFEGMGQGGGIEWSLTGRQANFLPVPEYTIQVTGRVVVTIVVNKQGRVIRATSGARGTTTTNQILHRMAEDAARRARFDLQTNAPEEQTGTITYNFIRQN